MAVAALADQIDKIIQDDPGTPAHTATMAHIKATYMRLGWTEREDMMAWHPTHLRKVLNEDMVIEAWILGRLQAGIRMRHTGRTTVRGTEDKRGKYKGPPIWGRHFGGELSCVLLDS